MSGRGAATNYWSLSQLTHPERDHIMGTLFEPMLIKRRLTAMPFLLFASVALAQGGDTGVDINKGNKLSPGETLSQSRDLVTKMKGTQKRILQLQDKARKQKDVIKLNCVSDKLERVR